VTDRNDGELYERGKATLLASWAAYARGATDAELQRRPGVAAAIFPNEPERAVYNNALFERHLDVAGRGRALDEMENAYSTANVDRFAAWVHESDQPMRRDLEQRGYTLDTTTRAMGISLDDISMPEPTQPFDTATWAEYLAAEGLAPNFLRHADHATFHVKVARDGGTVVAAALAFDFDGDCGIYNVSTKEHARRRGLGTALTLAQTYDARGRGCVTASLQSTPMAERLYASVGFRDLGRFLEYVPPHNRVVSQQSQ
jgi:GNAT superfamily N-acetyltransferase